MHKIRFPIHHSTDLLTARGVAHLVVHRTSGSTSYETTPPVRLETSRGVLLAVDMVVQRRDAATALAGYATMTMMMIMNGLSTNRPSFAAANQRASAMNELYNWVDLLQVSSVQFSSWAENKHYKSGWASGGMGTRVNIFILVPIPIGGRPTWLCETIHSSDIHTLCIGDLHNLFVADSITSLSTKYVSCSSWMTFSLNRSINLRDLHVVVFFYANEKMILMMIMNLSITACLFSWAKLN